MSGPRRAQRAHDGLVFEHGVAALHRRQHAVGARLHRQVHVRDQLGHARVGVDQALREFAAGARWCSGCARCPASPATYSSSRAKSAVSPSAIAPAIGVHVLAEQRDFLHALRGQVGDLGQHVVERARDFLAARVGHDAEAAVLAAAFHDRDEGARRPRRAPAAGGRTSRSRETRCRPAAGRSRGARRSAAAGDAASAGRTRDRRRARARRWPRLPGSRRSRRRRSAGRDCARFRCCTRPRSWNTFSCAFSRTEQVLNRMTSASSGVVGRLDAVGRGEHVGHLVRVVLVHLAAEGADVDALRHRVRVARETQLLVEAGGASAAPASRRSAAGAPARTAAEPPRPAGPVRSPAGTCPDARPPRR